jgi:hypothetical protein
MLKRQLLPVLTLPLCKKLMMKNKEEMKLRMQMLSLLKKQMRLSMTKDLDINTEKEELQLHLETHMDGEHKQEELILQFLHQV